MPLDNEVIDSLSLTLNGKGHIMGIKEQASLSMTAAQRRSAAGFKIKLPLFATLHYIDDEVEAMRSTNPLRELMTKQRLALRQVEAEHPLPSLDGVNWVSAPDFISYEGLMRFLHPCRVVEVVAQAKVRKKVPPVAREDLAVAAVVTKGAAFVDISDEGLPVAAAAAVGLSVAVDLKKEKVVTVIQERDIEMDAFTNLITLLRETKVLAFRHFRSAWEAIGTLQSSGGGGSHLGMLYNGKRVGCALKLHEGEEGYGPKSRKYFLEIVAQITPDRLRDLLGPVN